MPSERERSLEALVERARRIDFVTLVEQLERLFADAPRVGAAHRIADEVIRFRHDPQLVFHSSDVTQLRRLPSGVYELTATFLGATGSVSPLATFFTEDLLRGDSPDATPLGAFYDLFHHRLLSLFYCAKQRGRPAFGRARDGTDRTTDRALAITGLASHRRVPPVAPALLLGRSRIFASRPRGRAALEAALALAFPGVPIRLVDFVPRAVQLGEPQRMRLGQQNHALGRDARVGRRMMGPADALRLQIGPVDRVTLDRLVPGADEHSRLRALVDDVTGGLLEVDAEIELQPGQEPRAQLGGMGGRKAAVLGRDALLRRSAVDAPLRLRVPLTAAGGRLRLAP